MGTFSCVLGKLIGEGRRVSTRYPREESVTLECCSVQCQASPMFPLTRRRMKEGTASMSKDSEISAWDSASIYRCAFRHMMLTHAMHIVTYGQHQGIGILGGELLDDDVHSLAWFGPFSPEAQERDTIQILRQEFLEVVGRRNCQHESAAARLRLRIEASPVDAHHRKSWTCCWRSETRKEMASARVPTSHMFSTNSRHGTALRLSRSLLVERTLSRLLGIGKAISSFGFWPLF